MTQRCIREQQSKFQLAVNKVGARELIVAGSDVRRPTQLLERMLTEHPHHTIYQARCTLARSQQQCPLTASLRSRHSVAMKSRRTRFASGLPSRIADGTVWRRTDAQRRCACSTLPSAMRCELGVIESPWLILSGQGPLGDFARKALGLVDGGSVDAGTGAGMVLMIAGVCSVHFDCRREVPQGGHNGASGVHQAARAAPFVARRAHCHQGLAAAQRRFARSELLLPYGCAQVVCSPTHLISCAWRM